VPATLPVDNCDPIGRPRYDPKARPLIPTRRAPPGRPARTAEPTARPSASALPGRPRVHHQAAASAPAGPRADRAPPGQQREGSALSRTCGTRVRLPELSFNAERELRTMQTAAEKIMSDLLRDLPHLTELLSNQPRFDEDLAEAWERGATSFFSTHPVLSLLWSVPKTDRASALETAVDAIRPHCQTPKLVLSLAE
jgi:hypothetical protein